MKLKLIVLLSALLCSSAVQAKGTIHITSIKNGSKDPVTVYDQTSKKLFTVESESTMAVDINFKRPLKVTTKNGQQKIYGDSGWSRPFDRRVRVTNKKTMNRSVAQLSRSGSQVVTTSGDYTEKYDRHIDGISEIRDLKLADRSLNICPYGTFSLF